MQESNYIFESPDKGKTTYKRKFMNYKDKKIENNAPFSWPLMKDCITEADKTAMIDFIKSTNRFTNGPKIKQFEQEWSNWLGCKYSLFVSSGSTANFLLLAAIKEKYGLKNGDKVLVPMMTWVTNISPVIQLGLEPVFCDVDANHFSFNMDDAKRISEEHPDIKIVFVSHLFGFMAPIDEYMKIFPNAVFLEDVCESHGANKNGKKAGTFGEGSTFSSYFGHHMTTVEGGFVSTNDAELYNLMKMKRSHGMAREATPEKYEYYKENNKEIHPMFMFMTDGYNFRSMEINAVLGISQLSHLDKNNDVRRSNLDKFIDILSKYGLNPKFKIEGNSSFCLPFICDTIEQKNKLEEFLTKSGVETRPLCSGNLLIQPFLKNYSKWDKKDSVVNKLHTHGFFIGNNHLITDDEFEHLDNLLEEFFN